MTNSSENDLAHVSWKDNWFLANFPLTSETILDYFSASPFYDTSSNNEQVRMQGLDPQVLLTMIGVEYVVTCAEEPHFFVVEKQYRHNQEKTETLDIFYVLEGTIYKSPSFQRLISARLSESFFQIEKSLSILQDHSVFSRVPTFLSPVEGRVAGSEASRRKETKKQNVEDATRTVEISILSRVLTALSKESQVNKG
eukprot:jgi/Galph1/612/GphlegSOOS_G5371.1